MAKTETNVSTLKINRGTYEAIQANLSSIGENELIITTDKTLPIATTSDEGKLLSVDSSGEFTLITPDYASTNYVDSHIEANPTLESGIVTTSLNSLRIGDDYYTVSSGGDTWRNIKVNGTEKLGTGTNTGALDLQQGTNVTISESSGVVTISATDTTYNVATSSTAGLVKSSTTGLTTGRDYNVEVNNDGTMKVNVPWTDTTYSSETASQGGTDLSLVTTGEKYNWNSKQDALPSTTGHNGDLVRINSSSNISYGKGLPYIDCTGSGGSANLPDSINTDGLILVLCDTTPSTKYDGYIYIVTGSAS